MEELEKISDVGGSYDFCRKLIEVPELRSEVLEKGQSLGNLSRQVPARIPFNVVSAARTNNDLLGDAQYATHLSNLKFFGFHGGQVPWISKKKGFEKGGKGNRFGSQSKSFIRAEEVYPGLLVRPILLLDGLQMTSLSSEKSPHLQKRLNLAITKMFVTLILESLYLRVSKSGLFEA